MSTAARRQATFESTDRPDVALITNHGYAGVEIPIGGAPDTGGQIVYVNTLARTLSELGYRVTVFARGGFPYFESETIRHEPEYLDDFARYVFIRGGGEKFIQKEDIAAVLDEEVDWLDAFVRAEAASRGCSPWAVYEFVNTHYWDAAVIGMRLVERWRNDVAAGALAELLGSAVAPDALDEAIADRHWRSLGENVAYHLGALLLESNSSPGMALPQRVNVAAAHWAGAQQGTGGDAARKLTSAVENVLSNMAARIAPAMHATVAAQALGKAMLDAQPTRASQLEADMNGADRHIWTPHSLGELKDENFRDRSADVRRPLKFCERRNHERVVCDRTRAFAATSAEIAERLATHFRTATERVFYFPPCVDQEIFRQYTDDEQSDAYEYLASISGIAVEKLKAGRIVFETSRMDRTKRKDLLLKSFRRAASQTDDVYLFIGGGPDNDLFKSLTELRDAEPALCGRAFLTGFIPEPHIGPLFSIADVFVSASEMEGFGMSVSQAAAASCAIVSSDLIPFSVQYVPDDAIIVPAGDEDAFATAIVHLLTDEADRTARAARLVEKVKALDWKTQTAAFVAFLKERGVAPAAAREHMAASLE